MSVLSELLKTIRACWDLWACVWCFGDVPTVSSLEQWGLTAVLINLNVSGFAKSHGQEQDKKMVTSTRSLHLALSFTARFFVLFIELQCASFC